MKKIRSKIVLFFASMLSLLIHVMWVVLVTMCNNTDRFGIYKAPWFLLISISGLLQIYLFYQWGTLIDLKNEIAEAQKDTTESQYDYEHS